MKTSDPHYRKEPSKVFLEPSNGGFTIRERTSAEKVEMAWKDIARIFAFKRDLFSHDCVCVMLESQSGKGLEIDETMDGFIATMVQASQACPGCMKFEDWYMNITVPAFQPKLTELYKRPNATNGTTRTSEGIRDSS